MKSDSVTDSVVGNRWRIWLSLAVTGAFLFYFALLSSSSPISTHGEAREGLVVKNMLDQGNFILPRRNEDSIPSKPPLFHWIAAFALRTLQLPQEFAVRFPSFVASSLVLGCICWTLLGVTTLPRALATCGVVATGFEWFRSSTLARVDMVYVATVTGAFCILVAILPRLGSGEPIRRRSLILLGVVLGFGVLGKGPVALVLPLFVAGVALTCEMVRVRRWIVPTKELALVLGSALPIGGIWYLAAYYVGGDEFVRVQLMRENVARFLGLASYDYGHRGSFGAGLVQALQAFLPWSLLIPLLGVALWADRDALRRQPLGIRSLSLLWVFVTVIVFSISASKRPVYFLPAALPLSYLLWEYVFTGIPVGRGRPWESRFGEVFLAFLALLFAATVFLTGFILLRGEQWQIGEVLPMELVSSVRRELLRSPLWLVLLFGALWCISRAHTAWTEEKRSRAGSFAVLGLLGFYGGVGLTFAPGVAAAYTPQAFVEKLTEVLPKHAALFQFRRNYYPTLFYASRSMPYSPEGGEIPSDPTSYVILQSRDLPDFVARFPEAQVILTSENFAHEGKDRLLLVRVIPEQRIDPAEDS